VIPQGCFTGAIDALNFFVLLVDHLLDPLVSIGEIPIPASVVMMLQIFGSSP
jgi:hypothetical protein